MRQVEIFRFWLPLFASWLLMTAEGPLVSAAVNRMPDEVVMLAALGIVYSLSVLIESPVINLLATSTALVDDRASFLQVRRFTLHWMVALTVVSTAVAFVGPFFDLVVRGLMGVPEEAARWVRPGMKIMVPWTAAIAWRRFLQGVLIRFGYTRHVGLGTAVRLAAVVTTALSLLLTSDLSGIHLAVTSLVAGVTAEALYATWAVRPLLARELAPGSAPSAGEPLSYRSLFSYHLPLASTAVLTLLIQPMVAFSLARLDQPTLTLAAWQLVIQLLLLMRASALALPEVVIALARDPRNHPPLRRFSFTLAASSLAAMALFSGTPLANLYLLGAQSATPEVGELARLGILLALPMPAIVTLISWRRGLLMVSRRTGVVNAAMAVRLVVFVAVLGCGLALRWPGIPTAAWAVNVSVAAELLTLWWRRPREARG